MSTHAAADDDHGTSDGSARSGSRGRRGAPATSVLIALVCASLLAGGTYAALGALGTRPPDSAAPPPSIVRMTVNPGSTFPISRFVYGVNCGAREEGAELETCFPRGATLNRLGGNRWSAYDWTTNYSNAGSDWGYSNDDFLSSTRTPGDPVRASGTLTFARGAGLIVTVPMLGYVAGDGNGEMTVWDSTRSTRLATRFKVSQPAKQAPFTLTPDPTRRTVYQDEFANWVIRAFPDSRTDTLRPIFFSLDNEPDAWGETHQEIMSAVNDKHSRLLTYDDFIARTIAYATALKSVSPGTKIFAPGLATWVGYATLGRWPSPDPVYGSRFFLEVYLDKLRDAERAGGRRLVDVLDLHWYPEVRIGDARIVTDDAPQTAAMVEARLQAPRSLWDPQFDEKTWVSANTHGPIRLIPRMREMIAAHYPGTRIAITEYFFGRLGDISGGIAQVDALGIFGREGVFAATLWPQVDASAPPYGGDAAKAMAYAHGAFALYRNYDGKGGQFGNTGLSASTSDDRRSSIYASRDDAGRTVLVVINKTRTPLTAEIHLAEPAHPRLLRAFTLTSAGPRPIRQSDRAIADGAISYPMAPLSATTLVLQ